MTDDKGKQWLAEDFVAGLVEADFDRMRSALCADATWSVPGDTAISGVARGVDAVIERASAIAASEVTVEFQQLLWRLDDVAVRLHNTGRRGEVQLDEQVFIVFMLRDGGIASAQNLISDVPGLNEFFAAR